MLRVSATRCLCFRRASAVDLVGVSGGSPFRLLPPPLLLTHYRFGASIPRQAAKWTGTSKTKGSWRRADGAARTVRPTKRAKPVPATPKRLKKQPTSSRRLPASRSQRSTAKPVAQKKVSKRNTVSASKRRAGLRRAKALSPYERQTVKYNQRMARIEDLYKDYKRSVNRKSEW